MAAFFCKVFLGVYAWGVINGDHSHDRRERSNLRGKKTKQNKVYRQKRPRTSHICLQHTEAHIINSLSYQRRSIKLTYCIWWNSWVLTSASCFSCNFLSVSPPKDLSTALLPRGPEGCWSPYIKTVHALCAVACSRRRMWIFFCCCCSFKPHELGSIAI